MIKQSKTQINKANKNFLNLLNVVLWRQLNVASEQFLLSVLMHIKTHFIQAIQTSPCFSLKIIIRGMCATNRCTIKVTYEDERTLVLDLPEQY